MKRLDRYVTGLFLRGFWIFGGACLGLYVTVDFFDKVDTLAEDPTLARCLAAGAYYVLQGPLILHYLLPSVALLSAVAAAAALARGAELTTLQSSGISIRRAFGSLFAWTLLLMGAAFVNQEWVLPAVSGPLQAAEEALKRKKRAADPDDALFHNPPVGYDRAGWVLQAGSVDLRTNVLSAVTALRRNGEERTLLTAARAVPEAGGWRLFDGQEQVFGGGRPGVVRTRFGREGYFLSTDMTPASILKAEENPLFMGRRALRARMREHKGIAALRVQYYNRLAAPLGPLVLVTAGLPAVLWRRQRSFTAGVFFTIVVAGLYFFAQVSCAILGSQRLLTPQAAAFLPAALFLAAGAWLWTRVRT